MTTTENDYKCLRPVHIKVLLVTKDFLVDSEGDVSLGCDQGDIPVWSDVMKVQQADIVPRAMQSAGVKK